MPLYYRGQVVQLVGGGGGMTGVRMPDGSRHIVPEDDVVFMKHSPEEEAVLLQEWEWELKRSAMKRRGKGTREW